MTNFTFQHYHDIANDEKKFFEEDIFRKADKLASPRKGTVSNLLAYSKALSVRKSETMQFVSVVLN